MIGRTPDGDGDASGDASGNGVREGYESVEGRGKDESFGIRHISVNM